MASRLHLQSKLEDLLESKNVYYQPPESKKIEYPAIIYSKNRISLTKANDTKYLERNQYSITVVSRLPDNAVISKILELPYSSYDRSYVSDNLYHDVITLYF